MATALCSGGCARGMAHLSTQHWVYNDKINHDNKELRKCKAREMWLIHMDFEVTRDGGTPGFLVIGGR